MKTTRTSECFSSVSGDPEPRRKRAPILTKQRRVKLHPILHSTRPNIPAEDQRGFLSENYKKTRGFSVSLGRRRKREESAYTCQAKAASNPIESFIASLSTCPSKTSAAPSCKL